jgi:outer membrane lipoprotein-sorting protein
MVRDLKRRTQTLGRRARWAVPAGAVLVTGGVLAGSLLSGGAAQAAPVLPSRTPAQLLAAVAQSTGPALSGTVTETASLGLPSLPGNSSDPTSITSLLTGSHTVKVAYASPQHYRISLPAPMSETDLIRDGSTAYLWQSTQNTVTEFAAPAKQGQKAPAAVPSLTPQQAAQQALAVVGPTTTVSTDSNVMVAGQAAYELVLAPKDTRSLIGQIRLAIDGSNGVPLRVQVFARNAASPAISVGFTSVTFATPPASQTSFTPPPGAKIVKASTGQHQQPATGAKPDVSTTGTGWLTVLSLPTPNLTGATKSNDNGESAAVLHGLLNAATSVHGSWGSGKLLQTHLVSVLMTDSGQTYVGAVEPSVLYAAAAQHK